MAEQSIKNSKLADAVWSRYSASLTRGHADFQKRAAKCEDFYIGGGRQWDLDVISQLELEERPWLESNLVFSLVNSVIGYQTQSRLDIAYKPKETGDQELADVLSKIGMHVLDANKFPWIESEVFADGMIQSRGYFDIRMDFDDNMKGNISITEKDPLDIIPDPDAKSYDPDEWADVMETRWMTMEDIEQNYGKRLARMVSKYHDVNESDFGTGEIGHPRNKFAGKDDAGLFAYTRDEVGVEHVKVIERQYWKTQLREFFVDENGDMEPVPTGMTEKAKLDYEEEYGLFRTRKTVKRVRWCTSTKDVILHDDWSPYDHFTIIPFFPYFRRGVTIGLVDNLISVQEMYNKILSQELHTVNSTANSGWLIEEESLVNKDIEDLENQPAKTGDVLEYKRGRAKPEKITPNQIPSGLQTFGDAARGLLSQISGVSEIFQSGGSGPETAGVAIQARVQQNAVQLAAPLDNMFRTRHMIAQRILELIQDFYTEERVFNVTMPNAETGEPESTELVINQEKMEGDVIQFMNDTTQGKYDVVISDIPDQVTFQNTQFAQAIEMRKFGIEIPDDVMVRLSSLSSKNEIAKRMSGQPSPEEAEMQERMQQAEVATKEAEAEERKAAAVDKRASALDKVMSAATAMNVDPAVGAAGQAMATGIGLDESGNQAPPPEELPPDDIGQQLTPEEQMMMMQQQQQRGGMI
jgi:hypothetical protein